tara:strand:- start:7814 stop:8239 length:426 start_codon:yes stop_codon:yes gene_type:complete
MSNGDKIYIATQKRILQQSRQSSSDYTFNLAPFSARQNQKNQVWNNQSDRTNKSVVKINVPRNGNSTKGSITSLKPGALSAPGSGCDIKHGTYQRYLLRKKGNLLKTSFEKTGEAKIGNKTQAYTLLSYENCDINICPPEP